MGFVEVSCPLPLQSTSKQRQIDVDTCRTQQQALQEWLFTPIPGERSEDLLRTLHKYTLAYGLGILQKRMEALVDLDLKLSRKYACLQSDREVAEGAYSHTVWRLSPFPTGNL